MESHVVEKHAAGSVPSGKISECLDAGQCAHLFHAMTSNTIWILVKICRSGQQECMKWETFNFTGQYYSEFPRLVGLLWLYFILFVRGGGRRFLRAGLIHRNRPENLSHFLFQSSVLTVLHFVRIVVLSQITLLIQIWELSKCSDSVIHHRQIMARCAWIYLEIASQS